MKDLKDSGLVTQLVVVATMMPKIKQYIDDLIAENESLKADTIPYKDLHKVVKNVLAHPVKELTDEEILQFQDKVPYTLGSDLIEFARAILRKAQEK